MVDYLDRLRQPGSTTAITRVKLTSIPEGYVLEATYFGAYREVAGDPQSAETAKYINIGFNLRGKDYYLASEDSAVLGMVISTSGVYLPAGAIPFAVFEETTAVEDCAVIISGTLHKKA